MQEIRLLTVFDFFPTFRPNYIRVISTYAPLYIPKKIEQKNSSAIDF